MLRTLASVADMPIASRERLRDGAARSQTFQRSILLSSELEGLLEAKGIIPTSTQKAEPDADDDIPF